MKKKQIIRVTVSSKADPNVPSTKDTILKEVGFFMLSKLSQKDLRKVFLDWTLSFRLLSSTIRVIKHG